MVYVAAYVPRRNKDGSPSKHKRLIYGDPDTMVELAIINAALAVKHYMTVTFGEDHA